MGSDRSAGNKPIWPVQRVPGSLSDHAYKLFRHHPSSVCWSIASPVLISALLCLASGRDPLCVTDPYPDHQVFLAVDYYACGLCVLWFHLSLFCSFGNLGSTLASPC